MPRYFYVLLTFWVAYRKGDTHYTISNLKYFIINFKYKTISPHTFPLRCKYTTFWGAGHIMKLINFASLSTMLQEKRHNLYCK